MTKVIVIDDQPLEGKMIGFILGRDCPYAVYAGQAYTAEAGIALAREKQPDLIFLDITMPGMDGLSAIGGLRAAAPETRIVMLTAHDDFDYIRQAMRSGANDYLLKPTRPKDIKDAVDRFSRRAEEPAADPVAAAKRYVEEHLDSPISLSGTAERLYLSPAYFSRLFRQRTGQTFSAWLTERRILRAKRFLEETELSVAEISARVGYQEANSFTRVFRAAAGASPTEYRKSKKGAGGPG